MPTLSASDYTNFVKLKAANAAYTNGKVPIQIQRTDQPYATASVLNAQLFASQASLVVTPRQTALVSTALGVHQRTGWKYEVCSELCQHRCAAAEGTAEREVSSTPPSHSASTFHHTLHTDTSRLH